MSATQTTPSNHKAPKAPRNGVDTPKLLATINAVGQQPEMAKFQFRARNTWLSGNHSRTTIDSFYGAGQEMSHRSPTVIDSARFVSTRARS